MKNIFIHFLNKNSVFFRVCCLIFSFSSFQHALAQTYCSSEGGLTTYEWIEKVEFSVFQNTSGNNSGYGNFTTQVFNVPQLGMPTIKLTPGISNTSISATEYWRVWIDYNQDLDFSDPNELAFDSNGTSAGVVTGKIFVPYTATPGPTRMRVAMKFVNSETPELPEACGGFLYGEVEDYTLNIIDIVIPIDTTNTAIDPVLLNKWHLFPNPATSILHWQPLLNNAPLQVDCYSMEGKLLFSENTNNNSLNIGTLPNGTYFLKANIQGVDVLKRFVVLR